LHEVWLFFHLGNAAISINPNRLAGETLLPYNPLRGKFPEQAMVL
jgi:hypothetical protein